MCYGISVDGYLQCMRSTDGGERNDSCYDEGRRFEKHVGVESIAVCWGNELVLSFQVSNLQCLRRMEVKPLRLGNDA